MATKNSLCWPDSRGWIGIGIYLLTIMVLGMMWADASLRNDDFFKTIATLIIGTGFVNGVVSWAYSATQGGGELANSNADLVKNVAAASFPQGNGPQEVKVINPVSEPVPTEPSTPDEKLPDYAK